DMQDLLARANSRIAQEKGIALPPEAIGAGQPTVSASQSPEVEDPNAFQPEALPEWGTNGPVGLLNSVGSGAMEAIFQTKDMVLAEPDDEDKSDFRRQHEADL